MKKLLLFFVMPIVVVGITVGFGLKSSAGKAGATGSPGEGTCVQCHSTFDLNSGDGSVTLSNAILEAANWEYTPGETYDMELTIAHTGAAIFGFGLEALDAQGLNAGTLIVSNADETQLANAGDRINLIHKKDAGLADDTKTFSFQWTAPEDVDDVTFYIAANAANNDGGTSGDNIYSISKVLTKNTTGIVNTAFKTNLNSYPNPAKDVITIELPSKLKHYHISIFNSVGQLIDTKLEQSFSVADYQKGTYYIIVSDDNNRKLATSNFVKL